MEEAVVSGESDVIGLGRPLCTDPGTPRDLLEGRIDKTVCHEDHVKLAQRGFLASQSADSRQNNKCAGRLGLVLPADFPAG